MCIYIRGVWGAVAPQKPTTHYKNKIKWKLFLYCEPGYFFSFSQARPGYFFCSFQRQIIFFYSLQRQVIFFFQNQRQEFFWENNPAPPPPPPPPRISNGRPLSPAMSPVSPAPRGLETQMTGALQCMLQLSRLSVP